MEKTRKKFDLIPYLFLAPAAIFLVGITFYPFISSLIYSFYDYSFLKQGMEFVGFENYIDIISEGAFTSSITFTLKWVVMNLVCVTILAFTTALLLRQKLAGSGVLKAVMLIPWIIPQVVTGYVWSMMASQDMGIITHLLNTFGLVPDGFSFYSTTASATILMVAANSWKSFPFVALMLYSKMQAIPKSQIEAAQIDGATGFQVFYHITMPYIMPIYSTCMMLCFLWTFNAYDIIKVMTNGAPLNTTISLSLLVQREAFTYMEISRSCAMSVMMFLLALSVLGCACLLFKLIGKAVEKYHG